MQDVGGGHRRGRVLVIDDEAMVAAALRRSLTRHHDVTTVLAAKEALDMLREGQRFDAILCDLLMPGMSGMQLHDELLRAFPDQASRMVFVTASGSTPEGKEFLERVTNPRVDKPFNVPSLQAMVRSVVG